MSRDSRAAESFRKAVADASRKAPAEARRAAEEARRSVPFSLTDQAEAALREDRAAGSGRSR